MTKRNDVPYRQLLRGWRRGEHRTVPEVMRASGLSRFKVESGLAKLAGEGAVAVQGGGERGLTRLYQLLVGVKELDARRRSVL